MASNAKSMRLMCEGTVLRSEGTIRVGDHLAGIEDRERASQGGSGLVLLMGAAGVADASSGSAMVATALEELWMHKDAKGA